MFVITSSRTRSCIGFLGNRSGGLWTDDRARPRVAYRGALYRVLLLNTDIKLNKQSRTMFQGWSRSNNPQAKVLTTMPRTAWQQGVVSPTVSPGNQVAFSSTQTLPLHARLCRGGPYTSLANRGNNMETNNNLEGWAESFGNQLGRALGREVKLVRAQSVKNVRDEGWQIAPQIVVSSTPDLRKRLKKLIVSPQDTAAKKPEMKRTKASPMEEEWVEVPARKNLWKKKPKLEAKRPDWLRRTRPEAVLIKPAEGVSYAAILKGLKKLLDLKCSKEGRGWLDTALKEVIGASGTVRHLLPRIEIEIANIEPSIEAEDVEDAIRGFFDHVGSRQ